MVSKKEISVIIPAYNCAVSLGRCLDSVFSQELLPTQVIVVNDGSTDATAEVANRYFDRITYIRQENQGQGAARNAGLKVATGEFIAFLDADDYWLPGFLRTCVDFLNRNKEAIAVSTAQIVRLWGHGEQILPSTVTSSSEKDRKPQVLGDFFSFWAEHDHIGTGDNVIRAELIRTAGGMLEDLRMSQDLEYWGYLATFGKWGFIPEPHIVRDGTISAAAHGHLNKYRRRWVLAPEVEKWQRRILPRLMECDMPGFQTVRGRVAKGFAHAKILSSQDELGLLIILRYGEYFPKDMISSIMLHGSRAGRVGWKLCCHLIRFREILKSLLVSLTLAQPARKAKAFALRQ